MEYQDFICAVEKGINLKLEGGVRASLHTIVKNNGREKTGVVIETPGIPISPTIYLEEFYEYFLGGKSLEETVQEILRVYREIKCEDSWNPSKLNQYAELKDKIVFKVIHTEKNQALLESIPHIELLDLSIVFYALLEIGGQGTATMTINNEHLQCWHMGAGELFAAACKNVKRLLPAQLCTMQETVEEIMRPMSGERKNLLEKQTGNHGDFMYVLSNSLRSLGAACIVYPEVLDQAGVILGEDYYVLPSSIHEVILVPKSRGMEHEEMEAMVREINAEQVAEEEILSDHAYIYERSEKRLQMLL